MTPSTPKPRSKFWAALFRYMGWTPLMPAERPAQSVICVAPHTSNTDFFIGLFYYLAYGGVPNFLIKKEWFVFPLNLIFKAIGGIPVDRKKGGSTVSVMIEAFREHPHLHLAVTPEGSRSFADRWKTGFYRIALGAGVPIEVAKLDYATKEVGIIDLFYPTGDLEKDIRHLQSYYSGKMAKKPEQYNDHPAI